MKLLQDIIDEAVDEKVPVGTLLRRCLVLEQKIKNEKFRQWLNWELDGYFNAEEVPSYREFHCVNMGLFIGLGVQLNDQPIPMHILSEPEREAMETVKLRQPAASYNTDDKNAQILWSQSLVTKYQHKFLKGAILNRAWQEIPRSVLVGLLEQVRTRVLRFALDMKDEIGKTDDVEAIPAPVVERSVVQNFYGGNVVIAQHAGNISVINAIHVEQGNLPQLENALESLGLEKRSIEDMKNAMAEDSADGRPTLGQKTLKWATDSATYLAKEGLKVGVEVAKGDVRRWLMQYTGWSG